MSRVTSRVLHRFLCAQQLLRGCVGCGGAIGGPYKSNEDKCWALHRFPSTHHA